MPQIGWFELLLIILVAVLVIGPKEFPIVLKKLGTFFGTSKFFKEQSAQKKDDLYKDIDNVIKDSPKNEE